MWPNRRIAASPEIGLPETRTWRYVLGGALIGGILGLVEALVTAVGARDYWWTVQLHWGQLGFAGWGLGAIGGHWVARAVRRARVNRRNLRLVNRQCLVCGYDLRGNLSGRCPECGAGLSQTPPPS
jgi:hypothetical protein